VSEVFVSYARPNEAEARRVADGLRGLGHGVWRDDELPAHRAYTEVIEERLRAAKAVVVLWSAAAVKSQWVRAEAEVAREAGTLVQLRLDGATLPLPFNQIQCADMLGWAGDAAAPGWLKVVHSVEALIGGAGAPAAPRTRPAQPPAAPTERRLAVLAFDNLSTDPEMGFFSDGVSEEIQETLARGAELKVIGRTSAFQLRGANKTVRKAASELRATHVLDGSVRRAGQRVRISAQLIECASETTLWANRFDGELADIFALQDEIAAAVAGALRIAFARPSPPAPIDPAAYDLYLKARVFLQKGLSDGAAMTQAIELFRQAVTIAPQFAKAWSELAATIGGASRGPSFSGATRAEGVRAAKTALAIDASQGTAYSALSHLAPLGCYADRQRLLEQAIAAAPTEPTTLSYMAHFCLDVGRQRDAEEFARRAAELDPGFMIAGNAQALVVLGQGRYAEARSLAERNLARWPQSNVIKINATRVAALIGDWDWFDRVAGSLDDVTEAARDQLASDRNLRTPDPGFARSKLDAARRELAARGSVAPGQIAALHRLGLVEEAFELADQSSYDYLFDPDPDFQPPRAPAQTNLPLVFSATNSAMIGDPRFIRFCAKLGLVDYWTAADSWPDCADDAPYDFRADALEAAS
jgi:TolB-like protein/Flp pilus assembly protein TadD